MTDIAKELIEFLERRLKETIEESERKPAKQKRKGFFKKKDRPGKNEHYWFVDDDYDVIPCVNRNQKVTDKMFNNGRGFMSKAEAEVFAQTERDVVKFKRMCSPKGNVELQYSVDRDSFYPVGDEEVAGIDRRIICSPYRFSTKEEANKAIEAMGKEALKRIFYIR